MNIFAFSEDPWLAALWLDDVRKNKMILESCQLLSAAVRLHNPETTLPVYKLTHKGHPCTAWVGATSGNYSWLLSYAESLAQQRNRPHGCTRLFELFRNFYAAAILPQGPLQPFANCAANKKLGLDFRKTKPTTEAYRAYITARWALDTINLTWKNGEQPKW